MSYIGRCQLSGYKSIKNVSCEFNKGLNIIIGNNGSGKTNLLEFIYKVLVEEYSGLDIFKTEIDLYKPSFINNNEKIEFRAEGKISEDEIESKIIVDQQPENKDIYIEFVQFNLPLEIPVLGVEYHPKYSLTSHRFLFNDQKTKVPFILDVWISFVYRDYHMKDVLGKSDITDDSIFKSLSDSFEDSFKEIKSLLSLYTPIQNVRVSNSIRVTKIDSSTYEFRNIVFEYKIDNDWLSWNALSDGTKRLLYIFFSSNGIKLTNQLQIDPPIMLIEEPEIGIHPHQLHLLMTYFKERAEKQQIIITTHSPQILDVLGADEFDRIFVAEIDYETGTSVRKLTEKETEKAKLYLQDNGMLSDYWRFSDFQRSKESK